MLYLIRYANMMRRAAPCFANSTRYALILPSANHLPPSTSLILSPVCRTLDEECQCRQHKYNDSRDSGDHHYPYAIRLIRGQIRACTINASDPTFRDIDTIQVDEDLFAWRSSIVVLECRQEVCVLERCPRGFKLVWRAATRGCVVVVRAVRRYLPIVDLPRRSARCTISVRTVCNTPATRCSHDGAAIA